MLSKDRIVNPLMIADFDLYVWYSHQETHDDVLYEEKHTIGRYYKYYKY